MVRQMMDTLTSASNAYLALQISQQNKQTKIEALQQVIGCFVLLPDLTRFNSDFLVKCVINFL